MSAPNSLGEVGLAIVTLEAAIEAAGDAATAEGGN
jgi:hypothetical protein